MSEDKNNIDILKDYTLEQKNILDENIQIEKKDIVSKDLNDKDAKDIKDQEEKIRNLVNEQAFIKKEKNKKVRKKVFKVVLKSGVVASCCLFLGVGISVGDILSENLVLKSGVVASCCLFLGVGISVGDILSENFISKKEQSKFKFNVEDLENTSLKPNIILTSNSASSIFKEVGDSVVNISTKSSGGFFYSELKDLGSGSGIIYKIDNDKVYILTNNHVIQGASYVTISVTGQEQIDAKLVGADPRSDLAVLSVSKEAMNKEGIKNITVAKFADSDTVEVGDFVFPIGNALGRGKVMTQGMISAHNKQINIDGKNLTVLQTDAAINPGNSGGALINTDGEVVGINTAKLSSSAIEGIGYAIPSNIAKDISNQIINNGYVQRPYFGIIGKTITQNTKHIYGVNIDGVIVVEVEKGSNADKAGIKAGDIIVSFNGKDIKSVDDLSVALNNSKPNDVVSVDIFRDLTKPMTLEVTLSLSNTDF